MSKLLNVAKNKKIIISILILTNIVTLSLLFIQRHSNNVNILKSQQKEKTSYELMTESCANQTANVWRTECSLVLLDKIAAEREWKMRKLESLKEEDVNKYEMMGELKEHIKRIRDWRMIFDGARDKWCDTEYNYYAGSGTPGAVAECKLNLEIRALEQLDYLHGKLVELTSSLPVKDFNPSDEQLLSIMNKNKTQRGCVWAGEDECEDQAYTLKDLENFKK